jgi:hypothetical protein
LEVWELELHTDDRDISHNIGFWRSACSGLSIEKIPEFSE